MNIFYIKRNSNLRFVIFIFEKFNKIFDSGIFEKNLML